MTNTEITKESRIKIKWNCFAHEYTKEAAKSLINEYSEKYGIPTNHIKIEPNIKVIDENDDTIHTENEILNNIHDPKFQQKLFQDYININEIKDIDLERLFEMDDEINYQIDYSKYESFNKISIKWIELKNFMSFGNELTRFNINNNNGLVLITGNPANQAGKSILTGDAIKFLLYGKTNRLKTQDQIFNRFLPNEIEVIVRGHISINGEDFIIERKLTRPKKTTGVRKCSSTVQYFRVTGDTWDPESPLEDYNAEVFDNKSGDVRETNKTIKENLIKEDDFNLIASANSKTLDSLIDTGDAGLSKLFSRFIGLSVIEDKEIIAKTLYKNKTKEFVSGIFSAEKLLKENISLQNNIEESKKNIEDLNFKLKSSETQIKELNEEKDRLLSTKGNVDANLVKLDFHTIEKKKENILIEGKKNRALENEIKNKLEPLKNIVLNDNDKILIEQKRKEYRDIDNNSKNLIDKTQSDATKILNSLSLELGEINSNIKNLTNENLILEKSKICPTCQRPYEDETLKEIENKINNNKIKLEEFKNDFSQKNEIKKKTENDLMAFIDTEKRKTILQLRKLDDEIKTLDEKLSENQSLINEKNKLELKLAQLQVELNENINSYKNIVDLIKTYESNQETIEKNNNIDINIYNIKAKIISEETIHKNLLVSITEQKNSINNWGKHIKSNMEIIDKLEYEHIYIKHYKLLMEMLSGNGIKKMLLQNIIPVINVQLNNLLNDLTDFSVSIEIDEKNNIAFNILKENEDKTLNIGDLKSASGFERTMASLALRSVLNKIGCVPMMDILTLDEITACVSDDNFSYMYELLDKIKEQYKIIFVISHSSEFNQYFDKIITIEKINNISHILL